MISLFRLVLQQKDLVNIMHSGVLITLHDSFNNWLVIYHLAYLYNSLNVQQNTFYKIMLYMFFILYDTPIFGTYPRFIPDFRNPI